MGFGRVLPERDGLKVKSPLIGENPEKSELITTEELAGAKKALA